MGRSFQDHFRSRAADHASAVITGAASGIGLALATRLGSAGTRLVLADINEPALAGVAAELGAVAVPTDVSSSAAMDELAAAAPDADLICLNAGIVGRDTGAPWEVDPQDWDRVFAVNVGGVVHGLRAFVPRLLAAGRPARILITASLAGLTTFAAGGAYAASKHAVLGGRRAGCADARGHRDRYYGAVSGAGPHRDVARRSRPG